MKRIIALLLALIMCLPLCACGNNSKETGNSKESKTTEEVTTEAIEIKYNLGDTVSTDIMSITLEKCQFTYYVSNNSSTLAEPTDKPHSFSQFAAKKGECIIAITYTIKNIDRTGYFSESAYGWEAKYNGNKYDLSGNLSMSAVLNPNDGSVLEVNNSNNILVYAGQQYTMRTCKKIKVDPENITDSFEITIPLDNSSGEHESFTYVIPER